VKATVVLSYRAECCTRSHLNWFRVEGADPVSIAHDIVKRAERDGSSEVDDVLVLNVTGAWDCYGADALPARPEPKRATLVKTLNETQAKAWDRLRSAVAAVVTANEAVSTKFTDIDADRLINEITAALHDRVSL
jgi:hypothetical protein